jgi:CRISPR-associated endonuclease/helicase Cas3
MPLDFIRWYEEQHGYKPFPWQTRLAELISTGHPPTSISVPTGSGKTAIIAVWYWAIKSEFKVPKRLVYVVDRRLIVDSVTDYAERLGCNVIKMRGGVTIDNSWMMDPHKPSVIVSTVDQAGSRLLWRGYGVSPKTAPIHAALIGNDALIVLDEAHISTPFATTLEAVRQLRVDSLLPWHVVTMTATPVCETETLGLSDEDCSHPVLRKRLESRKLARLIKVDKEQFVGKMVTEARAIQKASPGVIGVICNTTKDARAVFDRLDGDKVLLTGRIRPADRDRVLDEYLPRMLSGSRGNRQPMYVVATQTIEVGADLDFDALVTQNAPIDALRQRFGRLDRLGEIGESLAVIIHKDLGANDECRVYGKVLLSKTWAWLGKLQTGKGDKKRVDFGISAMQRALGDNNPPLRDVQATRSFTAENLRQLRQTVPPVAIDISPWLHGDNTDDISVSVVWRADLLEDVSQWVKTVDAAPPVMAEAMPCPVYEIRRWLGDRPVVAGVGLTSGRNIRPGDLLVIPSAYGGYGPWGWDPNSDIPVNDIGNMVGAKVRLIGAEEGVDIKACLKSLGINIDKPVGTTYPAGLVVTAANPRVNGKEIQLEEHLHGVGEVLKQLTDNPVVQEAAQLHDIGKEDSRFQVLLGARDCLLAKSSHASPWAARLAHEWSGLPAGWRHEVASVAMLPEEASDLLRYLVGTHHGYARAVLPVGGDYPLWIKAGGPRWGNMTERLNEEHGAWGLAYLEALVRLSDWIQSEREQCDAL